MSHSRAQAGVPLTATTNNDHNIHTATTPRRFARPANVTEARALRASKRSEDRFDLRSESGNTTRSKWFLLCRYRSPSPTPVYYCCRGHNTCLTNAARLHSLYE